MKKIIGTRALAPWRGSDEYMAREAYLYDWDYHDCRAIVVSWYDSIDQCGLSLLARCRSWRYEAQAQHMEDEFVKSTLVDPVTGKRYPMADIEEDILHILKVMIWMERGIFERVVTIGFRKVL